MPGALKDVKRARDAVSAACARESVPARRRRSGADGSARRSGIHAETMCRRTLSLQANMGGSRAGGGSGKTGGSYRLGRSRAAEPGERVFREFLLLEGIGLSDLRGRGRRE